MTADVYELTVRGQLAAHWREWIGARSLRHDPDGTTTITIDVDDQAHLHGLLIRIRDIGAPLLAMRVVDAANPSLAQALRTERLILRAGVVADAAATWAFRRLPEVAEWLTGTPGTPEEYRAFFADPDRLADTVIIELAGSGKIIGDFMLRRSDAWTQIELAEQAREAQVELGWVIDPRFARRGYATEAVRALLRHSFEDLGVRRVTADCFLANEASWRLMERVGMRREVHAVRDSLHRSGQWLDTVGYAVLADEWSNAVR